MDKEIENEILGIVNNPANSFWLRTNVLRAIERDPVDALNDAEVLHDILKRRFSKLEQTHLVGTS